MSFTERYSIIYKYYYIIWGDMPYFNSEVFNILEVYLDNSATTKVCDTAIRYAKEALEQCWHNPSSLYKAGMDAERLVSRTRTAVAKSLNCREDEIFFVGCGTEANNTAIFGAAKHGKKRGGRIVTTAIEHPSVSEPMKELENQGFEVVRLKVDGSGKIDEQDLRNAINQNTILVSIMLVNNESGAIQPIKAAADAIKERSAPALLHCDAIQAFGKMPIDVNKLGVDLLSISGHKLHAPKGVGVLYKSKKVHIPPLLLGGGQESGFRSGTEAVPNIYALCGAIKELGSITEKFNYIKELNEYGKSILSKIDGVVFNSPDDALPYIINISVLGYRSEILLHFLEAEGIYVSSGSACSKGKASSVLTEMGIDKDRADSALRISLGRYNKPQDFDLLCNALKKAQERLRKR